MVKEHKFLTGLSSPHSGGHSKSYDIQKEFIVHFLPRIAGVTPKCPKASGRRRRFLPRIAGVTLPSRILRFIMVVLSSPHSGGHSNDTIAKTVTKKLSSPHSGGHSMPLVPYLLVTFFLPRIAGVTLGNPTEKKDVEAFFPA